MCNPKAASRQLQGTLRQSTSATPGVPQGALAESNTSSLYTSCLCKQTHEKRTEDVFQWALENILDEQQKPKRATSGEGEGSRGGRLFSRDFFICNTLILFKGKCIHVLLV